MLKGYEKSLGVDAKFVKTAIATNDNQVSHLILHAKNSILPPNEIEPPSGGLELGRSDLKRRRF